MLINTGELIKMFLNYIDHINIDNKRVMLRGWVHKITDLSHIVFVKLRDKSGIVQLVCDKDQIKNIRLENAIEVIGTKCENEKAPGGIEIKVEKIKVVGKTYYEIVGPVDGVPLVFIHGITGTSACYPEFILELASKGYKVLIFDLFGRGFSSAPGTRYDDKLFIFVFRL